MHTNRFCIRYCIKDSSILSTKLLLQLRVVSSRGPHPDPQINPIVLSMSRLHGSNVLQLRLLHCLGSHCCDYVAMVVEAD